MAAVTFCSDFGAHKNKVCDCFCCLPICLPWSDEGPLEHSFPDSSPLHQLRKDPCPFVRFKIDWSASERCIYQMGPDDSPANSGAIKAAAATTATKSLQSCPTLCDPIDRSPQAPQSLGLSKQEYWSGLPFPSPIHESEKWKWSRSVVSDS